MQRVPTIDLQRFKSGSLTPDELDALAHACGDHGFFLLTNHSKEQLVDQVFAASQRFFAQPKAVKRTLLRNEMNPLGYFDAELTKQKRDQKEVYDFKAGGYISSNPDRQTRWPNDAVFKNTLTTFFEQFTQLAEDTMQLIFVSLGMSVEAAATLVQNSFGPHHSSAARLNYYPFEDPLSDVEAEAVPQLGDMALHHHTDPGAITLLLQDERGGLQTLSKTAGWIDVPPQPGTIVVNVGDVLQVWTNDRAQAAVHRVVPVAHSQGRYSTPFFYQPHYNATIEPWVAPNEAPLYRAFSWREFIRGRVTDNFSDSGEADIQIDRYRLSA